MPHIQEYLRDHTLEQLTAEYAIKMHRHGKYPNLVLFRYHQIDSPMFEPLVQECRGLILDEADDWRAVSFPYTKFFNHGEPLAAPLDWSTARVYEKVDGSLCVLYPYKGEWLVSTSGTADAGGLAGQGSVSEEYASKLCSGATFADLFWQVFVQHGYALPSPKTPLCFIFELLSPENRVVVRVDKPRLLLHGVRDLNTFEEQRPEQITEKYNWECVKSFPLRTVNDVIEAARILNPVEDEGFVVVDAAFRRLKIKSPRYVALAHAKDGFGMRRMLTIARSGETDEFMAYFPEFKPDYDVVKAHLDWLCTCIETDYARLKNIDTQKDFALEAVKVPWSAALFALRRGKAAGARQFLNQTLEPGVERLLEATRDVFQTRGHHDR